MRIILLAPDLTGTSGWSRYALDLGRALKTQGHELICIVAKETDTDWCTQYAFLRPPTSYLHNPLMCVWHAFRLVRLFKKLKPDVVHFIAEPYALLLPLIPERSWRTVMTIHGSYSLVPLHIHPSTRKMFEKSYCLLDRIISVSIFTKNHLKEQEPELFEREKLDQKITVIHNAIDVASVSIPPHAAYPEKRIISVSAVKRKKGYIASVDAFAQFLQAHPIDARYDIYGSTAADPSFMIELQAHIEERGLSDRIHLHGSVDEATLRAAYASADLFLLPSLKDGDYFEGFGLVFLEANAHGVPVIGPTTGGCPEAIKEGVSGYVCDPEDAAAIAKRMEDVLIKYEIKREECRRWAEEHDVKEAAGQIVVLYERED